MKNIQPFLVVLGIAQDGGVPQAGAHSHPAWRDLSLHRLAASLGIVDPLSGERWMIEATPDFREQLYALDSIAAERSMKEETEPARELLSGIAITHAHIGHYTGLIHLGREAMSSRELPLLVMPRMAEFLRSNAPWEGLLRQRNIRIIELSDRTPLPLNERLALAPFPVPHRDEYSETVGFILSGPTRRALFLPDIDRWEDLDRWGERIEEIIAGVDIAYIDATFFDRNELLGRDMSAVPHPTITESIERFAVLPAEERRKIRFIHLNHTNPALDSGSDARRMIEEKGFAVAVEGEMEVL
jgi:pyrroloquinoline quinone biosynthesis protein B